MRFKGHPLPLMPLAVVFLLLDVFFNRLQNFASINWRAGAISVSERTAFIGRVRNMARLCAQGYLEQREALGYPLLKGDCQHG